MADDSDIHLREAITLAYANTDKGGRPFGWMASPISMPAGDSSRVDPALSEM